jgi:pimeloyl-ACP methyl ester carboxylesterase
VSAATLWLARNPADSDTAAIGIGGEAMSAGVDYAFLHGGGQGSWVWDETIAALHRQDPGFGRALALDAPGCGTKRGRDTHGIDNRDIAHELIADIEGAGLRDVVLVGHSQAGQVLPFMAELRPDLFRRLVYISCSIPAPGQGVHSLMGTGRRGADPEAIGWPYDPATTDMMEGFGIMFCNDMGHEQKAAFTARLGIDAWPAETYTYTDWAFAPHAMPATFILCLQDNILPPAWQERFAERYGCERRVHVDAGHQVMNTRPETLAEILRNEVR